MTLDFATLYLIILFNSMMFVIVWGGFSLAYRNIPGAHHWLAASVMTMLGGVLMSGDGSAYGRLFMIGGNAFVVLGFTMIWTGIRVFYGLPPVRRVYALMVVMALVAGVLADETRASQNIAYALSQCVAMGLSLATLLRKGHGSLGAMVAAGGVVVGIAGQGTEALLNTLRILGHLSTPGYYRVAAALLVAVIFGSGLWNFGFLLMAVDRLHRRLASLAMHDDLTALRNRRSFLDGAEHMMRVAREERRGLSVLLVDLDGFKDINDQLGHAAGDAALRHFANECARFVPDDQLVARVGGDEFGVALFDLDTPQTLAFAEGLARAVERKPLPWRNRSVPLTISIGIAVWDGNAGSSVTSLLEEADAALYETKRRGRNGYTIGPARTERLHAEPV